MVDSVGPLRPDLLPLNTEGVRDKTPATTGDGETKEVSFKDVLKQSIQEVNELQKDAETAIQDLATGKRDDYAGVITAVQKADIAFKTLMQVRNKLVDAYQEFNRMRV